MAENQFVLRLFGSPPDTENCVIVDSKEMSFASCMELIKDLLSLETKEEARELTGFRQIYSAAVLLGESTIYLLPFKQDGTPGNIISQGMVVRLKNVNLSELSGNAESVNKIAKGILSEVTKIMFVVEKLNELKNTVDITMYGGGQSRTMEHVPVSMLHPF